ncbi:hypothetical protein K438DRAFT_1994200 [Mycena galopus ATCC 62051]|nr:hypothetical protein K438DRAFT_1994200 [Mycena galopus ATCC 62051]
MLPPTNITAAAALLIPTKQVASDAMPSDGAGATAAATEAPATVNTATVVSQGPMIGCSPFLVLVFAPGTILTPMITTPDPTPTYIQSASPSLHYNSFPLLPSPTVEPIASHTQKRKGTKGKGKEKSTPPDHPPPPAHVPLAVPPLMFPLPFPPPTPSPAPRRSPQGGDDATPVSPPKRQRANIPATEERRPQPPQRPRCFAPVFDTHDGNPLCGSFTPTPADPRPIYGITSAVLFRGFTNHQHTQWNAAPGPKAIAYIMRGNGDIMQTTEMMRTTIADHFNIPRDEVLIGSPGRAERGPDPIAWLIGGLCQSELKYLLDATSSQDRPRNCLDHAMLPNSSDIITMTAPLA